MKAEVFVCLCFPYLSDTVRGCQLFFEKSPEKVCTCIFARRSVISFPRAFDFFYSWTTIN